MTLRAIYRDGMVVLPASVDIPDGAALDVRVVRARRAKKVEAKAKPVKKKKRAKAKSPTLNERLKSVIGKAKGLPRDFASQHDHYVHGTPKR
jgi:predicted DNA-binding antitoxin AbrB/MazE fold protein